MDSFVEVLEDLLFDELYLLFLVDSAAIGADTVPANCVLTAMPTLYAGKFVFVLKVLSVLESSIIAESDLKFLDLTMEVVDDILVLADMQGH